MSTGRPSSGWRLAVLGLVGACVIAAAPARAAMEGRLKDLAVKPQARLGLAFPGINLKNYRRLGASGLGVVRIVVSWGRREPSPGRYVWAPFDKRVIALQAAGVEPFLTLESDAKWGIRKETSHLANGTPKDLEQWQRFVAMVVERYDGDGQDDAPGLMRPVRYFQVANEWISPNNKAGGWGGSTEELIRFINASYDATKARSPEAIFVLGGIASGNLDGLVVNEGYASYDIRTQYLDGRIVVHSAEELRGPKPAAILKGRGTPVLERARYDVADVHLYGPVQRDPVRIKAIRDKIGGRPMLSSECGGPSLDYQDSYRPVDHFFAVMERNLMVLSEGLRFCLWFRLGGSAGVYTTPGNRKVPLIEDGKPKPGVWAYRLLAAALEGVERVERRGSGLDHYWLHRTGKTPLLVAWKGDGSGATVALPPGLRVGHVLRVTDAVRGTFVVEPLPASGPLRLGPLPLIAGEDLKRALRLSR